MDKMNKKKLLDFAAGDGEERIFLGHVLDKYEQCRLRGQATWTGFLSPYQQRLAETVLSAASVHTGFQMDGGYAEAERKILFFLPDWQEEAEPDEAMAYLRCRFWEEDAPTHRDLLGSLMGLSLTRETIGDLLPSASSADLIVSAEIAPYLLQNWTQAGHAHLRVEALQKDALSVPARAVREIHDTVAALRLDAVCASGFALSRKKAAELIAAGRVQLNSCEVGKPDASVREGDTVSARGFGKLLLFRVGGTSRKGRILIILHRYIG